MDFMLRYAAKKLQQKKEIKQKIIKFNILRLISLFRAMNGYLTLGKDIVNRRSFAKSVKYKTDVFENHYTPRNVGFR